ncbi:MAG: hypothetical protein COS42_02075 [Flavobacteriales bacterium CG03_land_8_20_14_0_80_35_15]|nr:hypothetical protein [Zetaproteobacteria bacterium]NDK18451.1 hypothetical protein [Flavobacteriales bacterium]OIO11767.1 MAG: hypothetical protein AUJ53_03760 [Flavobacteriaceae bacterium CG1_02_35_72]PIV18348.1 MAG: hypothetical protein COS42_02075 [Flavobacteriales bacterium CG03_land_8_20_14_0_80_35_15]
MKKITILLLLMSFNSFCQEKIKTKNSYEFSFAHGFSYDNFGGIQNTEGIYTPKIGLFTELNFDLKLPKNRFIGIGFAREQYSKNIDFVSLDLVLDNYRAINLTNFYDIHFRKEFKKNLNLTLGLAYFELFNNKVTDRLVTDGTNFFNVIAIYNDLQRSDDIAFMASVGYYLAIRDYFQIGVKGSLYYSLNGVESISLSPILKFSF